MSQRRNNNSHRGPNALRDRPFGSGFDRDQAASHRRLLDADQRFLAALYRAHRDEFPWLYEGRARG